MKIINSKINNFLNQASHIKLIGLASGPLRAALATAQIGLNVLAFVPVLIANVCYEFDKKSCFQIKNVVRDSGVALLHIVRAVIDFLPFSSFIITRKFKDDLIKQGDSDLPFYEGDSDIDEETAYHFLIKNEIYIYVEKEGEFELEKLDPNK